MKMDDLLGYPCFWKPPYVYVRAGPGKIFCGSVPENHQSISQLWPVPCIDSYHSYRRISIHWHLKIPTSQAGAVILRVHQVKERLCHSTPSGGYGIARGASSPVSMAGETVAALGVLETKRCNCGDRWGEMQQSALPHQQVISVIWEFDGNNLLSSWSDSIWISSHVKSKQPGNELLVLRQKWDEVRAAMLTQVLPERYILKFMKQTCPISFQRGQFQLKKKLQWSKQPEFVASLNWLDALPPLSTYTATYSLKQARIEHRKQTYVPTFMFLFYLIPKVEATNVWASCRCFPSRSIPSRDCRGRVAICGYAELKL